MKCQRLKWETLKKLEEERIQIAQGAISAISTIGEFYFQQEQQNLSNLSSQYATQKAYELELAGDNQKKILRFGIVEWS